jgi:O-antigen ligase
MIESQGNTRLQTWITQIPFLSLCALSASIPFDFRAGFIGFPVISILFALFRKGKNIDGRNVKKVYLMAGIFGIHILWSVPAFLYFHSVSFLEKLLPLLFFPLAIVLTRIDRAQQRKVLVVFIIAIIVSYTISLGKAYYNYLHVPALWGRQSDFFFHLLFANGMFKIHPTYYGLMGNIATTLAFYTLAKRWKFVVVLILSFFIMLINARISVVLQIGIVSFHLFAVLIRDVSWQRIVIGAVSIVVAVVLLKISASIYDYDHRKMSFDFQRAWTRSFQPDISDGIDGGMVIRMALWRNALHVIQDRPLFGAGFGLEMERLTEQYQKASFLSLAENQYNAHNQLLSFLISFGVIGTCVLIALILSLLRIAILEKNWLYLEFLLIIGICCLTESLLNRLAGITIFAFFNSFLPLKLNDKE